MRKTVEIVFVALALLLQSARTFGNSPHAAVHRDTFQSQAAVVDQGAPLPGGSASLKKVALSSKGAMVARLIRLGTRDVGSSCMADYTEMNWEVVKVLRGKYPKVMRLSLSVSSCPQLSRVRLPSEGETYILLSSEVSKYQIAKIVEYSSDRLKEVQSVLKAKAQSNKSLERTRNKRVSHARLAASGDPCAPLNSGVGLLS